MLTPEKSKGTGWRTALKTLQEKHQEYQEYAPLFTPYERAVYGKYIKTQIEELAPMVIAGALAEQEAAIKALEGARTQHVKAQAAEAVRWDPRKLADARENISQQINLVMITKDSPLGGPRQADKVGRILEEARTSGDAVRIRAASEVGRSITDKVPAIVPMVSDLERIVEASHHTAELSAAEQAVKAAEKRLLDVTAGLPEISIVCGQGDPRQNIAFGVGPFEVALKRIRTDGGQVEVLPLDHQDIQGWTLKDVSDEGTAVVG